MFPSGRNHTFSLITIQQSWGLSCIATSAKRNVTGFLFCTDLRLIGFTADCAKFSTAPRPFESLCTSAGVGCTEELSEICFLLVSLLKANFVERLHLPHVVPRTFRKSLTRGMLAKLSTSMFSSRDPGDSAAHQRS